MFFSLLPVPPLLGLLFFSFLLSLILQLLLAHYLGRSKKLRGPSSSPHSPPSCPVIGCLISFYKNRRRLLNWYTDLLSESPTNTIVICRLGACRTIVTANPDNVEHLLKTNFANYPKGRPFTDILGDFLGRGIFNADGDLWSVQRKLVSHEFSTKSLREFMVQTLEIEVENRLLPLLEESAKTGRVLDLQDILSRFAFDTVCQVSLGTDPCCLDLSRPPPPIVTAFDQASRICAMRGMAPLLLVWKIKRALNIGSERQLAEAVRVVQGAVLEIIHSKRKLLKQDWGKGSELCDGDLLTRLLVAGHDEEMVRDMVISFIMAGRDTTSSAMTWLFWLLSNHPDAKKSILSELNSILDLKKDGRGTLDFEALKRMNFLKACLCESMRLYPPVAWDSKHATAGDILPDGTPVRKGDRVTYFPYGMGRMENLWGEDRLDFKPERWFDQSRGRQELKAMSPFKYPVFQAGPRVCLGKEMAFIQMKYVVASIVRRFEIVPVSENQPVFVPLLTAHMAGGLRVVVRQRNDRGESVAA